MAILPDFPLPSNPETVVRFREATVSDAMDFSEVSPDCEEQAITLLLERLQQPEKYSDPRLWTGQDRRFALFMYKVYTEGDADTPLTYRCAHCQKPHTVAVTYKDLMESCKDMQGKPLRDVVHEGRAIIVHPLLGRDLEEIEQATFALDQEENPKEARKIEARIRLMNALFCMDIPALGEGTELDRRAAVEAFVLALPASEYKTLFGKVLLALRDMEHGIPSIYAGGRLHIVTPPVVCPNHPTKGGQSLQFPFRAGDFIPHV